MVILLNPTCIVFWDFNTFSLPCYLLDSDSDVGPSGFTDDNQAWLKPVKPGTAKPKQKNQQKKKPAVKMQKVKWDLEWEIVFGVFFMKD